MRIRIALPKHHLKERLIITAIGFFCFIAALILMDEALAEEAAHRILTLSDAANGLLDPEQRRVPLAMLCIGFICAGGSAISTWIHIPGLTEETDTLKTKLATGFILGSFGGLGALEFLLKHNPNGFSAWAIAGFIGLAISLFGGVIVAALYNAALRRKKRLEDKADK